MAAYNVQTWLNDIASAVHGTTVNKIPYIYQIANRAARALLLDVDPKETMRIVQLAQVFDTVFDYACPPDVKGDRISDIAPQAGRMPWDIYPQGYGQDFDANKAISFDNKLYTQWNTGVKSLRIEAPSLTTPITISDTSSITGWAATSGAASLTLDQTNYVAGGGALTFNLTAGPATGYVETSTIFPINLTTHLNQSTLFMWVYLPTGSAFTNVNLRWGTDSSNYYTYTATATQQGTAFQNGWNLVAFPWVSATTVGTPTVSSIKYARITFTYNTTLQTGVKVDNITSALGYYFNATYYSKYLFRDPTTNAFQESITDATDNLKLINLDTDSYNLFFNKSAYYVAQSLQGSDAEYDAAFWQGEYTAALARYKALNPSEAMVKATTYYTPARRRRGYPGAPNGFLSP